MKRFLAVAALLMTLLGGAAPAAFAAADGSRSVADAASGEVGIQGDTSWGGACDTPLCKPIF